MGFEKRSLAQHLDRRENPKKILALDGGGIRGMLSLGILRHVEAELRRRSGVGDLRLADYFDLISGTSTGAIIAAGLAIGMSVEEIRKEYESLGEKIFQKSWLSFGLLRPRYKADALKEGLINTFGRDTMLGSDDLRTGLLVMTKRFDSGSPWPLSNNPAGTYFEANKHLPLWEVVRASTAAPTFFEAEELRLFTRKGEALKGRFVDGGVSPHNNPALSALMFASMEGYNLNWEISSRQTFLLSLGTGRSPSERDKTPVEAVNAVVSLGSLMDDCADLVETMLQWMSAGPTARKIDSEIGDLRNDVLGGTGLFTYRRYNAHLVESELSELLGRSIAPSVAESLRDMDDPENMSLLHEIGDRIGQRGIDLPSRFDP